MSVQKRKNTLLIVLVVLCVFLLILIFASRSSPNIEPNKNTDRSNILIDAPKKQEKEDITQDIIDLLAKEVDNKASDTNNVFWNKELGYQMEYPKDWVEIPNAASVIGVPNYENVKVVGVLKGLSDFDYISIVREVPKNKIDSKTYMNNTRELILNKYPKSQIIKENEDLVGGNKSYGRLLTFVFKNEIIYQYQLYIEGSQGIYIITYSGTKDNFTVQFNDLKRTINSIKVEQK